MRKRCGKVAFCTETSNIMFRKAKEVPTPILIQPGPLSLDEDLWGCSALLVDKPQTWTSFDVCGKLKGVLRVKKVCRCFLLMWSCLHVSLVTAVVFEICIQRCETLQTALPLARCKAATCSKCCSPSTEMQTLHSVLMHVHNPWGQGQLLQRQPTRQLSSCLRENNIPIMMGEDADWACWYTRPNGNRSAYHLYGKGHQKH